MSPQQRVPVPVLIVGNLAIVKELATTLLLEEQETSDYLGPPQFHEYPSPPDHMEKEIIFGDIGTSLIVRLACLAPTCGSTRLTMTCYF